MSQPAPLDVQLAPVRRAVLERAAADAQQLIERADEERRQVVAAAHREVDEAIDAARRRARAADSAHAARRIVEARRAGYAMVLRARREAREQLVAQVRTAADALARDPRYPALLDRLAELARAQLGPQAAVERDPSGERGIVASVNGRRVDYRLRALADRAVAGIDTSIDTGTPADVGTSAEAGRGTCTGVDDDGEVTS